METTLTSQELERYSRHLSLPNFSLAQQEALKNSRVLIIGAGGLGCPIGLYLAASGIGTLGLVDDDVVSLSNLQRQVAFTTDDVGKSKADVLAKHLSDLNPEIQTFSHPVKLTAENAVEILSHYDIVIDGSDNFATRFLLADACYLLKKPLVHGAIFQFDAQLSVFVPDEGPCYRCLFDEPPQPGKSPSCTEAGVLGILPGTVGIWMATETIKLVTGMGTTLQGQVLFYDALTLETKKLTLAQDPDCRLCGKQASITTLKSEDYEMTSCELPNSLEVSVDEAETLINNGAFLLDVREMFEHEMDRIQDGTIIPLGSLNPNTAAELPKDKPLVVYCRSGQRSLEAVFFLRSLGYDKAVNMAGGILAWRAAQK